MNQSHQRVFCASKTPLLTDAQIQALVTRQRPQYAGQEVTSLASTAASATLTGLLSACLMDAGADQVAQSKLGAVAHIGVDGNTQLFLQFFRDFEFICCSIRNRRIAKRQ